LDDVAFDTNLFGLWKSSETSIVLSRPDVVGDSSLAMTDITGTSMMRRTIMAGNWLMRMDNPRSDST
jgi:hypothetical protein